jgi:signal transduction histidine kinase
VPPSATDTFQLPLAARQIIRASIIAYGIPEQLHPQGLEIRGARSPLRYVISFGLPGSNLQLSRMLPPDDGSLLPPPPPPPPLLPGRRFGNGPMPGQIWLTISSPITPPEPWRSPEFGMAFIVMTVLGAIMIFWATRQLMVPVRTLAEAAERLGRDVVNAPDLPETGPSEIVTAAVAFNTMASRIRRFVEDRTFLITAIGHDLRTPITRLKLRAEYMEDEEQRLKMLADLDEMESMVAATLAFGRDVATSEAVARIDLVSLVRTILDEAADGAPDQADKLAYDGPEHMPVLARPLSLKRAVMNLVANALKYGDAARVKLQRNAQNVQIDIDDNGPGIPTADAEAVFEPFRRLETSRNRETGGSGLGLSIARNIVRAHGGDILLRNLPGGGLRASVTLPV